VNAPEWAHRSRLVADDIGHARVALDVENVSLAKAHLESAQARARALELHRGFVAVAEEQVAAEESDARIEEAWGRRYGRRQWRDRGGAPEPTAATVYDDTDQGRAEVAAVPLPSQVKDPEAVRDLLRAHQAGAVTVGRWRRDDRLYPEYEPAAARGYDAVAGEEQAKGVQARQERRAARIQRVRGWFR
jgi:hypothetical protein